MLLFIGLIPFIFTVIALLIEPPKNIRIKKKLDKTSVWRDNLIQITITCTIDNGLGIVTLADDLPAYFEVVHGNNFKVIWKGIKPVTAKFTYHLRCTKRGVYTLHGPHWKAKHILGLRTPLSGKSLDEQSIQVKTRMMNIQKIRGLKSKAKLPFPSKDLARIGVATTDFREIREYRQGDSVKSINWKATARTLGKTYIDPVVNEYEVEGKKTVWIFLDASRYMETGSSVENIFEYAIEVTNGVSYYFLKEHYKVGMYIYNKKGKQLFYPETGLKQFYKISKELVAMTPSDKTETLSDAVEKCKGYLLSYTPLSIIMPEFNKKEINNLSQGVKNIIKLTGRRRKKPPVMMIHIPPYYLDWMKHDYVTNAVTLLEFQDKKLIKKMRSMGVSVIKWNPRKESFAKTLFKEVRK